MGARALEDYRHIPFNLDELALDAAARGLGVATMTDLTHAGRGVPPAGILVVPFGEPLKTGGNYSLCLQPSANSNTDSSLIVQWFVQQANV